MKLQEKVGKRIMQLRKEKKFSQQDLASEANIERSHLTVIESGKKNISLTTLERLMEALGKGPKEFFDTKEFNQ